MNEISITQGQYNYLIQASSGMNRQTFVDCSKTKKKLLKEGLMRQTVKSDLEETFWQVHPKCLILTEYGEKICSILWKMDKKETNFLESDIKVVIV